MFETTTVNLFGTHGMAQDAFDNAYLQGLRAKILSTLLGRQNELYDLGALKRGKKVAATYYLGSQNVEITRIVGSEGRCKDFDADFHPRTRHTMNRWVGIACAFAEGIGLHRRST